MFKTCRASRESAILCLALALILSALSVYAQNVARLRRRTGRSD